MTLPLDLPESLQAFWVQPDVRGCQTFKRAPGQIDLYLQTGLDLIHPHQLAVFPDTGGLVDIEEGRLVDPSFHRRPHRLHRKFQSRGGAPSLLGAKNFPAPPVALVEAHIILEQNGMVVGSLGMALELIFRRLGNGLLLTLKRQQEAPMHVGTDGDVPEISWCPMIVDHAIGKHGEVVPRGLCCAISLSKASATVHRIDDHQVPMEVDPSTLRGKDSQNRYMIPNRIFFRPRVWRLCRAGPPACHDAQRHPIQAPS